MTEKLTMYDVASDLDDLGSRMEDVIDLLYLYEEHRDRELEPLNKGIDGAELILLKRQNMGHALLGIISTELEAIQDCINDLSSKGYAAMTKEKEV